MVWDTVGPVVEAGSDETKSATFTSTSAVDRTTIASASATGATISTYAWTAAPVGITFGTPAALTTTITGSTITTYTITLTVTDSLGNVGVDTFTLTWQAAATPTATATGPTGTGAVGITITYTYTLTPTSVDLYYTLNTANPWTWAGPFNDASITDGFPYTLPGPGTYSFYAVAVGGGSLEVAPTTSTAPEVGTYVVSGAVNAASGLWVEKNKVSGDVIVHWTDTNAGAVAYNIFYTHNKLGWDFATPNATTVAGANSWTHTGACNDGLNWFYIVRPVGGTANSTMGYKIVVTLPYNDPATKTNGYWVSLPYNTTYYKDLNSIVIDIEGGLLAADRDYITACLLWNYTNQNRVGRSWGGLGWSGTNYAIQPGMCVFLSRANCLQTITYGWTVEIITPTV